MTWEAEAENWLLWARTPGHDAYWLFRDAFFDEVVRSAGRRTLELGCGEGRVARDLAERGHRVVGLEPSATLARYAATADPGGAYVRGTAEALPFDDCSFDLVVAYNSLMDVEDMNAAVREVARVLQPGGRLCACVTHPLSDAGKFDDQDVFRIEGSYLEKRRFEGRFERNGLVMNFRGWCFPLEDYSLALEAAGFVLEMLREPVPAGDWPDRWRRVPMFLQFRALKPSGG